MRWIPPHRQIIQCGDCADCVYLPSKLTHQGQFLRRSEKMIGNEKGLEPLTLAVFLNQSAPLFLLIGIFNLPEAIQVDG